MTVELFHWNPVRPLGPRRGLRQRRSMVPVANFGDLLGPVVVRALLAELGLAAAPARRPAVLLSVGSVVHLAPPGAVVWGSGVNGKIASEAHDVTSLDVRAVRGPRTRAFLQGLGLTVPEVYGDPALLLGELRGDLKQLPPERDVLVVPNLNDGSLDDDGHARLDPRSPLEHCLRMIATSRLVVGSSLHGVVVAEALGVPARVVTTEHEPEFKYADYYGGTGRASYAAAATVREGVAAGGEPGPVWDSRALREAFPVDLWERSLA